MSKQENLMSPVGTFMWANLTEPNRRFNPEGKYEVNLVLPRGDGEKFKVALEAKYEEYWADFVRMNPKKKKLEQRPLSIRDVLDEEGNETGDISFKFSVNARGKTRDGATFDRRIVIADSKGSRVDPNGLNIGNGTRGRVSFTLNPYNNTVFGVSMQLRGVQIVELVEFTGGPSFDPVEDGWTSAGVGASDEEDTGGDF